jgi:hypothetical protein
VPGAVSIREVAQVMRVAMSAPATQWPLVEVLVAATTAYSVASGMVAPSMPALTAAATAAAAASARPVLWVAALAATTRSTSRSRSVDGVAMPTGVIRIAAPLVVP